MVGGPFDSIFFFSDVINLLLDGNIITSANTQGCIEVGGTLGMGVDSMPSKDVKIVNNFIQSGNMDTPGIRLDGAGMDNLLIANNTIKNCSHGITNFYFGAEKLSVGKGISITNNQIYDCLYGIYFNATLSDFRIQNNDISTNQKDGVYMQNSKNGIISGNSVINNGLVDGNDYCGIRLIDATHHYITNNYIKYNSENIAINGIVEVGTSDNNIIKDNVIYNAETDIITTGLNTVETNNTTFSV